MNRIGGPLSESQKSILFILFILSRLRFEGGTLLASSERHFFALFLEENASSLGFGVAGTGGTDE